MQVENRFTQEVIFLLQQAIIEAEGQEVFATGKIDYSGIVTNVKIAARGNINTVPVNKVEAQKSSVLIHNHPSGNLHPSDNDLSIAASAADKAQGFYIINNDVTDVYVVVEPIKPKKIYKLNKETIASYIEKGGALEKISPFFEQRDGQVELIKAITTAFNENQIGVFEAGTGIGKSFGYLLPAMLWAVKNDERVVISTGTINLQQQLYEKDIPLAEKILEKKVKVVLLKGRQQYICKRRLDNVLQEQDLFSEEEDELNKIIEWSKTSATGSRSDLSFLPTESLWQKINSESDACMGMRCRHHETCFIMRIRKEASDAKILIVNHHLLFADIETRLSGLGYEDTAVLPPYSKVVFDEAHGIENAATSFFSEMVSRFKISKQLGVIYRMRKRAAAGLLFSLEALSSQADLTTQVVGTIEKIRTDFDDLEQSAFVLLDNKSTWRLCSQTNMICQDLLKYMNILRDDISIFTGLIREIIDGIAEDDRDNQVVWEAKAVLRRLDAIGSLCKNFNEWDERGDTVFWLEKNRFTAGAKKKSQEATVYVKFYQTPLEISHTMNAGVFEPLNTIVCTSATLQIKKDFSFWLARTGANFADSKRIVAKDYPSPFCYKENVLLFVPTDAVMPDSMDFQRYIESTIIKLIRASDGRCLVLFTSYESLRSACDIARSILVSDGIKVLKQGDDDRFRLLEIFRNDNKSVLFATDSFWEGVDIPGESLSQVIIIKLPFSVPSDPVFAARSENVEKKGLNPFMTISVPEAIIRFRQGFGRLIRRKTDYGVVTVLDKRIIVKKYGSMFIESLPKVNTCFDTLDIGIQKIRNFLK